MGDIEQEAINSIEFFRKLNGMTERIKCFNSHFYDKLPKYQINYLKRQEERALKLVQLKSKFKQQFHLKTQQLYGDALINLNTQNGKIEE